MTEEEKIHAGTMFCPTAPELKAIKLRTHNLNLDYNKTYEDETEKRRAILHNRLSAGGGLASTSASDAILGVRR